jgi:pimeloyl-ACP methyl ester carboxylesterase
VRDRVRLAGLLCSVLAALCLCCALTASAVAAPLTFGRCATAQLALPAKNIECATLDVPLDRADPAGGSVALAVQRVAPSAPQLGTIVLLAGGPGQAALPPFEGFFAPLSKLPALRGYELVSFDQRGTGQSGVLKCPGLLREGISGLGSCGQRLGAVRADYTSQASVEDLQALQQALGGQPLSLYAVSYGTKVAAMYAREYPSSVARMVLDSPVPLAGEGPLDSERMRALPRVFDRELCGAGACSSFAPAPDRELDRLVESLRRRPLHARIFNGRGRRETVSVTEAGVFQAVALLDLSAGLRELLPAAIASAQRGDPAPLARIVNALPAPSPVSAAGFSLPPAQDNMSSLLRAASTSSADSAAEEAVNRELSLTLLAATLCAENPLPWLPESPLASRAQALRNWLAKQPSAATAPFRPATVASESPVGFCAQWPPTPAAPPPPAGPSATPTLILSGDDDLRTPYEQDLAVAATYSDARILRVPDTGHSTVSSDPTGCAQRAMIAFLTGGQTPTSCPAQPGGQVLAPPPRSLEQLQPCRSRSTLAGRVATAVAQTLQEVLGQPVSVGGGLLGGYYRAFGVRLDFHKLSDIPGVTLTGHMQLVKGTARLAIGGRLHGLLTLHGQTLSGRLDGAAVRARLLHYKPLT